MIRGSLLTAVVLGLALGAAEARADAREDFEEVVPFNPGGSFHIENSNGSIEIQTWNEGSVRIQAEKRARRESHLEDIEIEVSGSGDEVRVETIHHRKRGGGKVSYVVMIPVEANVEARTANGSVTITGVHGKVDARSTNGAVKVEDVAGAIEARTTNGSIRADYQRFDEGEHRFKSTNGSIRVYLPSDAGAKLDAKTVNGSIEMDFPIQIERSSRRQLRGTFGTASADLAVETVNGSVKILER